MTLEIFVKSQDAEICVNDISVSGYKEDAYVDDCSAYFKGSDEPITNEDLLKEIMEKIDDDHPEIVQEISFENAQGRADDAYDRWKDDQMEGLE